MPRSLSLTCLEVVRGETRKRRSTAQALVPDTSSRTPHGAHRDLSSFGRSDRRPAWRTPRKASRLRRTLCSKVSVSRYSHVTLRSEGFSIRGFDDLTAPFPRVPQSTSTPRRSRRTAARWRYHPTTPSSCPTARSHTSDWRTTAAPSKMRPKPSSRTRTTSRRTTAAGRRSTRSGASPMPSRTSRRCAGCSRRTGTGA